MHIDVDGALDSAASGFGHAPPILERLCDKCISRDRRDCFVPISNFHRFESNLKHVAIAGGFGPFNPIATCEHLVSRELNAYDKTKNEIF